MDNDDRDIYHHGPPAVEQWTIEVSVQVQSPHQTLADHALPSQDADSPLDEEDDDDWITRLTPFTRHVASQCPLNGAERNTLPADSSLNYGYDFHSHVLRRSTFLHPPGVGGRNYHSTQFQGDESYSVSVPLAVGAVCVVAILIVAWLVYFCVQKRRRRRNAPPVMPDLLVGMPPLAAEEEVELMGVPEVVENAVEEDEV